MFRDSDDEDELLVCFHPQKEVRINSDVMHSEADDENPVVFTITAESVGLTRENSLPCYSGRTEVRHSHPLNEKLQNHPKAPNITRKWDGPSYFKIGWKDEVDEATLRKPKSNWAGSGGLDV